MQLPQLTEHEKLELQNLMLRVTVENERIDKFNMAVRMAQMQLGSLQQQLDNWKSSFNTKLKTIGITINDVNIDVETGTVTRLDNVRPIVEKSDATG